MRLLNVLLAACSAVLLLAACGGQQQRAVPKIDRATAQQLAAESDAIASAADPCDAAHRADQLQMDVEQAIADGHVPAALRTELRANVSALVNELTCEQPQPPEEKDHGEKKHKKKKKGEGD